MTTLPSVISGAPITDESLTLERLREALVTHRASSLVCLDFTGEDRDLTGASGAVLIMGPAGTQLSNPPLTLRFGPRTKGLRRPGEHEFAEQMLRIIPDSTRAVSVLWAHARREDTRSARFARSFCRGGATLDLQAIVALAVRQAPDSGLAANVRTAEGLGRERILELRERRVGPGRAVRAGVLVSLLSESLTILGPLIWPNSATADQLSRAARAANRHLAPAPVAPTPPDSLEDLFPEKDWTKYTPVQVLSEDFKFTIPALRRARLSATFCAGKRTLELEPLSEAEQDIDAIFQELRAEDPTFSARPFWQYLYAMSTLAEGQNYALGIAETETACRVEFLAGLGPDGKTPIFEDLRPDKKVSENGFDGIFKGEFPLLGVDPAQHYVGMETKTLALSSLGHINKIARNADEYRQAALRRAIDALPDKNIRTKKQMHQFEELAEIRAEQLRTLLLLRIKRRSSEPLGSLPGEANIPLKGHTLFDAFLVTNLFGEMILHHGLARIGEVMGKMDEYGRRCLEAYSDYQASIRVTLPLLVTEQAYLQGPPEPAQQTELDRRLCPHCRAKVKS